MLAHNSTTLARTVQLAFALSLATLLAGCEPTADQADTRSSDDSPTAIRWWSDAATVALEPRAVLDDLDRAWAVWIRHDASGASLELRCESGEAELASITIPTASGWVAEPDLTPLGEGVLCVWEAGSNSGAERGLVARTATLRDNTIVLGPEERPLAGAALTPRICRTGPDRIELVAVSAEDPLADLGLVHSVREAGEWSPPQKPLASPGDAWAPALAADARGRLHVAWDAFDGERFGVHYAILAAGTEVERQRLDNGAGYQAYPSIALTDSGAAWLAWEEAPQFGQLGGLRTERSLGLACVESGEVRWAASSSLPDSLLRCDFPQVAWSPEGLLVTTRGLGPSFAASARKANAAAGEDPGRERTRFRDAKPRTRVYLDQRARFFTSWWTRLFSFDEGGELRGQELPQTEGDNLATDTLLVRESGPQLYFATDLRSTREPRPSPFEAPIESRWRVGSIELPRSTGFPALVDSPPRSPALAQPAVPARALRNRITARADEPTIYFGDLHRHTHLSRCAGSSDGITSDVYRYARGPGALDFVAVTDHFQHLLPWSFWRNQRDVVRFHAPGRLVVFSGVERASKSRGHRNDIYLDAAAVRYQPEAWNDFPEGAARGSSTEARKTISIPHMMGRSESPWRWSWMQADLHRVFEVYQGTRGSYEGAELPLVATDFDVPEASVGSGLAAGHQFGFIASSDHGSTATGFAGVVAAELTRSALFEALQARHTFATTDFARVTSSIGPLAGGEQGTAPADAPLILRARGLAPVAAVEVFKNGSSWRRLGGEPAETERLVLTLRRFGPYPDNPMQIRVTGAELGEWHARRRGELNSVIKRTANNALTVVKGRMPLDLVLELSSLEGETSLEFSVGDQTSRVALAELELDRTVGLGQGFARDQLWRMGSSLGAPELVHEFFDDQRRAGDSYYTRTVFEDGNIVWSSPIRVEAFSAGAREQ